MINELSIKVENLENENKELKDTLDNNDVITKDL